MSAFHDLLTHNDPSIDITLEAVPDLQIRDRTITIGWTREMRGRLYQGLILESIEDGFPLIFFQGMRTLAQMTFEVLFGVTGFTVGINSDMMLMIVLNK
jgi:hypothetical protein